MIINPLRRFSRYFEITRIFLKYGFAEYVKAFHPAYLLARLGSKKNGVGIRPLPLRIKSVCEELGPTFIKLGQIASTRTDIFPEEFTEALSALQDSVKPVPFPLIKEIIESELGPINKIFKEFNEKPIGSASIAQVYFAKLNDIPVIVKVRRPNIEKVIELDIDMLRRIARIAEVNIPGVKERNPQDLIDTFARNIYKEIDFLNELANAEKFRENYSRDPRIRIPRIFKEFSSSKILVQEYIDGIKITEIDKLKENGINPRIIAQNGADIFLKQILIDGFFHADPHPGNIFVTRDGVIVPIDFGMVGRITPQIREQLVNLVLGVINHDPGRIARVIMKIGVVSGNVDYDTLQQDIAYIIEKFEGRTIKNISVKEFVIDINRVIRRYHIKIPQDLLYLGKALSQLEMLGRELDEDFNIIDFAKGFVKRHNLGRLTIEFVLNKSKRWFEDMMATIYELPENINFFFETIRNMDRKDMNKKPDRHLYWYLSGFGIMLLSMFIIVVINHPLAKVLGGSGIIFAFLIFLLQFIYSLFSY
jgi:ubiquinone biosynthesis protein|uniref:ABC1 atypical kinase-like domain-containing protein n=1 Tax=candidate division WOR-3 bacterium TaxID=2052148 RepID=A0A7V3VUH0_UNCW3